MSSPEKICVFVGIFDCESGQRFLALLERLTSVSFEDYWNAYRDDKKTYLSCLNKVSRWSWRLINEQISALNAPDFATRLEDGTKMFIREISGNESNHTIEMDAFGKAFLSRMSKHSSIISGSFFTDANPLVSKITCMDVARAALYELYEASLLTDDNDACDSILPSDSVSRVGSDAEEDNVNFQSKE